MKKLLSLLMLLVTTLAIGGLQVKADTFTFQEMDGPEEVTLRGDGIITPEIINDTDPHEIEYTSEGGTYGYTRIEIDFGMNNPYKVLLDDQDVTVYSEGTYKAYLYSDEALYPTQGSKLQVWFNDESQPQPSGPSTVKIEVTGAYLPNAFFNIGVVNQYNISVPAVDIDDEEYENATSCEFSVDAGQKVQLKFNTDNCSVTALNVNSTDELSNISDGVYEFTVSEETYNIAVTVEEKKGPTVTFICDQDYDKIKVISNASSNKETVLSQSTQTITFAPEVTEISLSALDSSGNTQYSVIISSITISGNGSVTSATPGEFFTIQDGAQVTISTADLDQVVYTLNCSQGDILEISQSGNTSLDASYSNNAYTVSHIQFGDNYLQVQLKASEQENYELISVTQGETTFNASEEGVVSIRNIDYKANTAFTVNVQDISAGVVYTFTVEPAEDFLVFNFNWGEGNAKYNNDGSYSIAEIPEDSSFTFALSADAAKTYAISSVLANGEPFRDNYGTYIVYTEDYQVSTTFAVTLEKLPDSVLTLFLENGEDVTDGYNQVTVKNVVETVVDGVPQYSVNDVEVSADGTNITITGNTGYVFFQAAEGYELAYDEASQQGNQYAPHQIDSEAMANNFTQYWSDVKVGDWFVTYNASGSANVSGRLTMSVEKAEEQQQPQPSVTYNVAISYYPQNLVASAVFMGEEIDDFNDLTISEADVHGATEGSLVLTLVDDSDVTAATATYIGTDGEGAIAVTIGTDENGNTTATLAVPFTVAENITITWTIGEEVVPNTATVNFYFAKYNALEGSAWQYINIVTDNEVVELDNYNYSVEYGDGDSVEVVISAIEGYGFLKYEVSEALEGSYQEVDGVFTFTLDSLDYDGGYANFEVADEETVGIAGINAGELKDAAIYNINGVKVDSNKLTKGLYIINGKKVLVK